MLWFYCMFIVNLKHNNLANASFALQIGKSVTAAGRSANRDKHQEVQ